MDLVVRTPHGSADVALRAFASDTTLGDLLRLVTGQAVPPVAELDGRATDTGTPLADAGLAVGSLIDTTAPDTAGSAPVVALLQVAGPGAGAIRPLASGRYRLGAGRRLVADELASAPVEISALELTVGDDGSVEARPGYASPVSINGKQITGASPWNSGMLTVGGRVFAIESPGRQPGPGRRPAPDARGLIAFGRPPRRRDDGPRHVVVDAVRDAVEAGPSLWRQRAGDLTAFVVPFGLAGDPSGPVTIDFATERGVALVGSESFTAGLARSLLVELTTLHGPADLDLAIATHPDLQGRWDWVKWLPHFRVAGRPQYITDETHLREWVAQRNVSAIDGRASPAHLTVLVVDEPALWTDRDSPLVALVSSHPAGLRLLALTDPDHRAPTVCSALVSEHGEQRARLIVPDRGVDVVDVIPALTEVATATLVARHLAPLDDDEQPSSIAAPAGEPGPATVAALLAPLPTSADQIVAAWERAADLLPERLTVPLGTSGGRPVTVDLGPGRDLLVTGRGDAAVGDVAFGVVAALATQLPPDRLSIVHVATGHRAADGPGTADDSPLRRIESLPHFAGRFDEPGAAAATRLVVRLATVVGALDPVHGRVVAVVDRAGDTASTSPGLVEGLVELARSLPALQLVVTAPEGRGRRGPVGGDAFAVRVDVEDAAGSRRGSLRIDRERVHQPFAPFAGGADRPGPSGLVVRPAVHGRPFSPLERRLGLLARRDEAADGGGIEAFVDGVAEAAERLGRSPADVLVPGSLPPLHRSETLLAERAGDAVPIGLVDAPAQREIEPLWWQPGAAGSLLLLGSPRSGVDGALSTLILGVGSRFSADELHLYCVDPLGRRRSAAALLPHTGLATSPDRGAEVAALLEWLTAEVERRRTAGTPDDPALLLLVNDVGLLRRSSAAPQLDHLATIAAGGEARVNLVATAWRAEEAGSLVDLVAERLVGAMADPADYERLGVHDPSAVEAEVGRCWSTLTGRMVQLALPPRTLASEVERLGAEPPVTRPPRRPTGAERGAGT